MFLKERTNLASGGGGAWLTAARWRHCVLALLALLFHGSQTAFGGDALVSKEYQVKAAYVVNFAKFTKWPAGPSGVEQTPLIIGVLGKNPFGNTLEAIARVHKIDGRDVLVKQFNTIEEAGSVHLLFIGAAEDDQVAAALAALKGKAVLTVGESDKFAESGGMITLVREMDKVRFEVNTAPAEREGLIISAELLKLAKPARKQH